MKIRAFRKLLDSVEEMSAAVIGVFASQKDYRRVLVDLANSPERREQFRVALLDAIKAAQSLDEEHV